MKKTKVIMIYPEAPSTYWGLKYVLPFIGKKSAFPPLGLQTVAAMLPDHYQVNLIDMNVEDLNDDDIKAADLVFISAMIVQKKSFEQVVDLCRRLRHYRGSPADLILPPAIRK